MVEDGRAIFNSDQTPSYRASLAGKRTTSVSLEDAVRLEVEAIGNRRARTPRRLRDTIADLNGIAARRVILRTISSGVSLSEDLQSRIAAVNAQLDKETQRIPAITRGTVAHWRSPSF